MGIFQAFQVGVAGLQAQSNSLSVISNNIANVNTTGYKQGDATFEALISGATPADYSPGGVTGSVEMQNGMQGIVTSTSSPTDLAISGDGFFAVSPSSSASTGGIVYTRDGSFTPDANGNLVNEGGFYLQGWPLTNGALPASLSGPLATANLSSATAIAALTTINPSSLNAAPIATSSVTIQSNLDATTPIYSGTPAYNAALPTADMAGGAIAPQFTIPITVVDSTGVNHTLTAGFLKTGNNSWAMEIYAQPGDVTTASTQVAAGTVTFNGDGTLASVSPALTGPVTIPWSGAGVTAGSISFNLGTAGVPFGTPGTAVIGRADGLGQFATDFNVNNLQQNGVQGGTLDSIAITSGGIVNGTFSDGSIRAIYQIPLVTFVDPTQLEAQSDNVFTTTADTGAANYALAGQNGVGTMQPDALENSSVDISTQLVDMIVAQRAYQANTKTISTTDTMLQDLDQMLG